MQWRGRRQSTSDDAVVPHGGAALVMVVTTTTTTSASMMDQSVDHGGGVVLSSCRLVVVVVVVVVVVRAIVDKATRPPFAKGRTILVDRRVVVVLGLERLSVRTWLCKAGALTTSSSSVLVALCTVVAQDRVKSGLPLPIALLQWLIRHGCLSLLVSSQSELAFSFCFFFFFFSFPRGPAENRLECNIPWRRRRTWPSWTMGHRHSPRRRSKR